jgi:hypothetical protein
MTTRRELLQLAACAALPTTLVASTAASASTTAEPADLHAVLVEASASGARAFGQRLAARGTTVHSLQGGDITTAWLTHVRPAWRQSPTTIAGLTTSSALFCFEQLAWSHGLRVVFHAEHIVHVDGSVEHALQRADGGTDITGATLLRANAAWPLRLADAMAARRVVPGNRQGPSMAALEPALPNGAQLLTSWVIAAA